MGNQKMDNPEKQGTQEVRRGQKKHNTISVAHHYAQRNTNNVIKKP